MTLPPPDGVGTFLQVHPTVRLHLVMTGSHQGEPLIFLHGFPEFWWSWRYQLSYFDRSDTRAIALDLRGVNHSDKPDTGYDPYSQAQDILHLMDSYGYSQATLIGHDYGGFIAYMMALCFPHRVRRVVAISALHPARYPRGSHMQVPSLLTRWGYRLFAPTLQLANEGIGIGRVMQWLAHHKAAFPQQVRAAHSRAFNRSGAAALRYVPESAAWLRDQMPPNPRLELPVLVLWAARDRSAPLHFTRGMEKSMPNALLRVVPAAGHWAQQEQPDFVNQAIARFIGLKPNPQASESDSPPPTL